MKIRYCPETIDYIICLRYAGWHLIDTPEFSYRVKTSTTNKTEGDFADMPFWMSWMDEVRKGSTSIKSEMAQPLSCLKH
jgi:hypothetical protein